MHKQKRVTSLGDRSCSQDLMRGGALPPERPPASQARTHATPVDTDLHTPKRPTSSRCATIAQRHCPGQTNSRHPNRYIFTFEKIPLIQSLSKWQINSLKNRLLSSRRRSPSLTKMAMVSQWNWKDMSRFVQRTMISRRRHTKNPWIFIPGIFDVESYCCLLDGAPSGFARTR